ncbi:hypothetical protein Tco_1578503 [Tanacetum coccineum]
MSDSEHSTVTYTSVSEDDLYMGSPGVEGPIFQDPPSPDYIPGPEEPEQAPPSPIYVPFVPEPVYPEFLPVDDEVFPAEEQPLPAADSPTHQSPGYIPESDPEEDLEEDDEEDPEEDPADYPADRGDDDDDAEDEHLAPAEPAAVAYSADQDPYIAYRVTARMSIRTQAPAPFLSEEVAERVLALPTPPPSPLSPYSSPLPQIPSPPLPIPPPSPISPTYVEGSLGSRAAGIRQRDALPSRSMRLLRVSRAAWAQSMDACDQAADRRRQTVISDLLKADHHETRDRTCKDPAEQSFQRRPVAIVLRLGYDCSYYNGTNKVNPRCHCCIAASDTSDMAMIAILRKGMRRNGTRLLGSAPYQRLHVYVNLIFKGHGGSGRLDPMVERMENRVSHIVTWHQTGHKIEGTSEGLPSGRTEHGNGKAVACLCSGSCRQNPNNNVTVTGQLSDKKALLRPSSSNGSSVLFVKKKERWIVTMCIVIGTKKSNGEETLSLPRIDGLNFDQLSRVLRVSTRDRLEQARARRASEDNIGVVEERGVVCKIFQM